MIIDINNSKQGGNRMKKVTIIYGSTTGNTERVAELLKSNIAAEVTLADASNADKEMVQSADLILLGASTWGYGEIQDDFQAYYDLMNEDLLKGKDVAVFGCGNSDDFPDVYCEAVNLIKDKAAECGANIIGEGLKVDGEVDDNVSAIESFAKSLV